MIPPGCRPLCRVPADNRRSIGPDAWERAGQKIRGAVRFPGAGCFRREELPGPSAGTILVHRNPMINTFQIRIALLVIFIVSFPFMGFPEGPNPKVWEPMGRQFYYNKKIITESSGSLLVWTYRTITDENRAKRIEEVKKYDPEKSIPYQKYHHECFLWEIDCANRRIKTKEYIDFDGDGKVIDRYRYDGGEWESVIAGSGAERLHQKACTPSEPRKPQKKNPQKPFRKRK